MSWDVHEVGCVCVARSKVKEVSEKEHKKGRPDGLNTVNLLKVASSSLNIGPAYAMQVSPSQPFCTLSTVARSPVHVVTAGQPTR